MNGVSRNVELDDPRVTLLDLLRERLDLPGTKKGCDRGQCGACGSWSTVGGSIPASRWRSATTAPRSRRSKAWRKATSSIRVQGAFIAHDGFQCGFCTPGQIMSAIGLINEGQAGDDPETHSRSA